MEVIQSMALDEKEMLLINKDFGDKNYVLYLKRPSDTFISIVNLVLTTFDNCYKIVKSETGLLQKIRQEILSQLRFNNDGWLKECENHSNHMQMQQNRSILNSAYSTSCNFSYNCLVKMYFLLVHIFSLHLLQIIQTIYTR